MCEPCPAAGAVVSETAAVPAQKKAAGINRELKGLPPLQLLAQVCARLPFILQSDNCWETLSGRCSAHGIIECSKFEAQGVLS